MTVNLSAFPGEKQGESGKVSLDDALYHIRVMACRVICDSMLLFPCYFNRLINDRYAPIRRITLTTLVEKNQIDAIPELTNSLVDSHISVREVARFYLNSVTKIDFANHYLDYMWGDNTKSLVTAIIALGEVGGPEHVEILAEYASHVDIKIKRAALRGLSLLSCEQFLELFYIALQSDNNGLSVEGYRGLRKKAHLIDSNRLLNVLLKSSEIHVVKYVLRLFAAINKWDQLCCLLSALQMINEDNIRVEIKAQLRKWISSFNRSVQAKPSSFDVEVVNKLLDRYQQDLSDKVVKNIKFMLR
ncbi:HEAT repeat domain-containing protein [Paenibacillus oryzisoli]|uniref:HEAT repeat domain-containing protein n=1 Tax=Paenibacillus oryzisoli TaxID=1850517 RepID=UPI003D2C340B